MVLLPQLWRKDGSGGIKMAEKRVMYIVKWTAVHDQSGTEYFFAQWQVDAWLAKYRKKVDSYSIEKVYK
jgi:hypothetical protein